MDRGQSFNRFEKKYVINREQKEILKAYLKDYMVYDAYSNNRYYTIYNVYFDTFDHNIIRQSVSKPKYKAKLRLRSYKCPVDLDDLVFLELKKKVFGKVTKRRVILTYQEALAFLKDRTRPTKIDYTSNQVMNEIAYYMANNDLIPNYFIGYKRQAMVDATGLLRITFDESIIIRTSDVNLDSAEGNYLLPEGYYLIEIKAEQNFPLWLTKKLSEMQLYARSFSKYGEAYKANILGDDVL